MRKFGSYSGKKGGVGPYGAGPTRATHDERFKIGRTVNEVETRKLGPLSSSGANPRGSKRSGDVGFSRRNPTQYRIGGEMYYNVPMKMHPRGCMCPFHGGHQKRKPPAYKGLGNRDGYKFSQSRILG